MASILKVDEIKATGSSNTGIEVHTDGTVTLPKACACYVDARNGSSNNFKTNGTHIIGHDDDFTTIYLRTDTHNAFDTTTGKFTCPVKGVYLIAGGVTPQNSGNNPRGYIQVYKGSNAYGPQQYYYNENYNGTGASTILECEVGDEIYLGAIGTNSVSTSIYRGHASFVLIG